MCRPIAYVVTRTAVHRCSTNSHRDEIRRLGLTDSSRSPDFVRVEMLIPECGLDIFDAQKYRYTTDQDYMPDWYNPEEVRLACITDLAPMLDSRDIKIGGHLDLSGLTSLPAGAKLSAGGHLDLSGLTSLPAGA